MNTQASKCVGCGRRPRGGIKSGGRCLRCTRKHRASVRDSLREKRQDWRANGMCGECGLVKSEAYRCDKCTQEADARRHSRVRLLVELGYAELASVLDAALDQAQSGKGKARHSCGEPFQDQKIVQICEWMGSNQGDIFQAVKKAVESTRLPHVRARRELLGAINYLAAAVIVLDRQAKHSKPKR